MEMTQTTLNKAAKYGIGLDDITEWAQAYGYTFERVDHYKRGGAFFGTCDVVRVKVNPGHENFDPQLDDADASGYPISIEVGNCPICGEKCAAFGWGEGGYHSSTCECGTIDFSG